MIRDKDSFSEQCGFVTFAQNNTTTDYLKLAYCQALSIKCSQQKIKSYAVIVDAQTKSLITNEHKKVFDYIIEMPADDSQDDEWKLKNEWRAWDLTPFKQTMKVESDMLFTTNIDHWWDGIQQKDVCLTSKVINYEGNVSKCRTYRKLFDDNFLPDVYSGLMYFRFSKTGAIFFNYVKEIYKNWELFETTILKNCRDSNPTTDVVFSIAALLTGVEECIHPGLNYPMFSHMKGGIQGWSPNADWTEKLYSQFNDKMELTLGFTRQQYPTHYYQKSFVTDDLIQRYEDLYARQ